MFNSRKWKQSNTSPFFCQPWKIEDTMDSFLQSHVPKSCLSRRKSMWMAVQYSSKLKSKGQKQLFKNALKPTWFRSESFPLSGCVVTKVLCCETKGKVHYKEWSCLPFCCSVCNRALPFFSACEQRYLFRNMEVAEELVWMKTYMLCVHILGRSNKYLTFSTDFCLAWQKIHHFKIKNL